MPLKDWGGQQNSALHRCGSRFHRRGLYYPPSCSSPGDQVDGILHRDIALVVLLQQTPLSHCYHQYTLTSNRGSFLKDRRDETGICNVGRNPRKVESRSVNEVEPPRPTDAAPSYWVSLVSVLSNLTVSVSETENVVPRVLVWLNWIIDTLDKTVPPANISIWGSP